MAKIKTQLISVMSELGAGTRGSSLGFSALKLASLKYDPLFFVEREAVEVEHLNHLLHKENQLPSAIRLNGIAKMYERIESKVSTAIESGKFPIIFSGDHSNAGGTIAGIVKANSGKRLGVIWVDAHADLHSPYTSPSGNVHGMPLATAISADNLDNKGTNVQPKTEAETLWKKMQGGAQRILPQDLFFIGVRSIEEPEKNLMAKHNIPNIQVAEARETGIKQVAERALEHLKDCDIIYISFDVDSMDPSVSVGTGTPVSNGFTEEETGELLLYLVEDSRLCAFETTEVNPLLDDKGNSMAEATFRVISPVIKKIENKNS